MNGQDIVNSLKKIVGDQYVSDEPEILICYSRDQSLETSKSPEYVALPENTEQVSEILSLAQKNGIAVVPWSTGVNSAGGCIPQRGGIILDMKRMDRILDIDEENMTATVQPAVNFGRIQIETLKKGLRVINPTAPASASCLANFLDKGIGMTSNKYGVGSDHIVNMKVVLPDGSVINTGSRMWSEDNKIYSPPLGVDLAGIFHASMGIFGICAEMTIKLYPIPNHDGIMLIGYEKDDWEITEDILREFAKEKYVIELFVWQFAYLATGVAPNNFGANQLMEVFTKLGVPANFGNILVLFYSGFTEDELLFHQDLLTKMAEKFQMKYGVDKLKLLEDALVTFVKNQINIPMAFRIVRESPKIERIRGTFFINWFNTTLDKVGDVVSEYQRLTSLNMQGLVKGARKDLTYFPDDLTTIYVQPLEYGRTAMLECDFFPDQADPESMKRSLKNAVDVIKMTLDHEGQYDRPYGGVDSGFGALQTPRLGTYYLLLQDLKKLLDPNNIMNPGRLALPVE
jgi:FAD/FMN-containing dehydrogenase